MSPCKAIKCKRNHKVQPADANDFFTYDFMRVCSELTTLLVKAGDHRQPLTSLLEIIVKLCLKRKVLIIR